MKKYFDKMLNALGVTIKYGCLTYCILEYIGNVVLCIGSSMEPTILSNDVVLTERISTRLRRFDIGDVIIAKNPSNPQEHICKRIVGLPGDKIYYGFRSCTIPTGHVWLEGDNINNSNDSRTFGPLPQGLLCSRVLYKIWPLSERKNS